MATTVDVKLLCQLWKTPLSTADICRRLGVTKYELYALRTRYSLGRRAKKRRDVEYIPTPEDIAIGAAAAREKWSEEEENRRRVCGKRQDYRFPAYQYDGRQVAFTIDTAHYTST
jgi:hypothetical protein